MKASNYPRCKNCGDIARPHILMFGDYEFIQHQEQDRNFNTFASGMVDLILLVGSSGAVPINDYIAHSFKQNGAKVININPDPTADKIVRSHVLLPLTRKKHSSSSMP